MSASNKKKLRKELNAAMMTEKQNKEQLEAKKLKAYTLTFAVVMILVVAIVVGVVVSPLIEGAIRSNSHAVTVGEHKLTASELSYFYIDAITAHQNEVYNQYYNTFGNYWSMMLGFDTTMPLNEQTYDKETGKTWADYFIDGAIDSAKDTYALYDDAVKNNYKLTDDEQKNLDSYLGSLELYATYNNYSSVKSYLRATYGNGATEKDYTEYYKICTLASSYYNNYKAELEYEYNDYRAYEKGDEEGSRFNNYSTLSFLHHTLNYESYLGEGTKDANGTTTWTDAEKDAAREAAKADMLQLMAAGITDKDSFNKALQELKIYKFDKDGNPVADDKKTTATEVNDIFYENITMHADATEWLGNTELKPGEFKVFEIASYAAHEDAEHEHSDTCGCAKTVNGYTFVLFTGRNDNTMNMVNVRHILVKFTGGTKDKDGNTVYTVAEKEKAKSEAEKLLQQWKDGKANEESFGELANKESDDQNGKVTNGGLYEDIYPGQMVQSFEDWCFAEGRKAGDTGIVETEYGYHVMYYSSADEMTYRDYMIDADLRAEDTEKWHDGLVEKLTYEVVNLEHMDLDLVIG